MEDRKIQCGFNPLTYPSSQKRNLENIHELFAYFSEKNWLATKKWHTQVMQQISGFHMSYNTQYLELRIGQHLLNFKLIQKLGRYVKGSRLATVCTFL